MHTCADAYVGLLYDGHSAACSQLQVIGSQQALYEQTQSAASLASVQHRAHPDVSLQSWLPARALVQKAIDGRYEVDASGQIIKLPVAGCPWKEHLNQLEQELKLGDTIKFCIYEVS